MPQALSFENVIERLRLHTEVEMLVSPRGEGSILAHADVHRPGMALMGYDTGFQRERIQIFGESEIGYLSTLDTGRQRGALLRVFELDLPGVFISSNLAVSKIFLEQAESFGIPVARVGLATDEISTLVRDILSECFAPHTTMHATLVDVYGVGLLVTGRSGIGKSETALDLVERGHRLVADDIVQITRSGSDVLLGSGRKNVEHLMEIRGVGIVDIFPLFGVRAIRMQKRIEVELRLEEWDEGKDYDRHGLDRDTTEILGVRIPRVIVPIFPGKNNTVIAEVVALDFMLKTYGIDTAKELNRKLIETMSEAGRAARYLKHDRE